MLVTVIGVLVVLLILLYILQLFSVEQFKLMAVNPAVANIDSVEENCDGDKTKPEHPDVIIGTEQDMFKNIWNGKYTYSASPNDYLEIMMKNQDHGLATTANAHWMLRSYGPTILTGDSLDKTTSIYIELLSDWKKCCTELPRIKILLTDNKTGVVTSMSAPAGSSENTNAFSTKIIN